MIEKVKLALRISSGYFDLEVAELIESAKDDLRYSGVKDSKLDDGELDPLVARAVITYCKAHFGYDNPDKEGLVKAYDSIKTHLCLSNEYKVGDANA